MEFYWKLEYGDYKDLKSIMIPPASVEAVKRRWEQGQPINLSQGSIPPSQIRSFEMSDKPFSSQPMLTAGAAQAFHEPIITADGVEARWVKKSVTKNSWEKRYSQINGYKLLGDDGNMAVVAFKLATHDVNPGVTPYCTEAEIKMLTDI